MTQEQQQMLKREMDDALKIEDKEHRSDAIQTVTAHYLEALCDCQRKTAERVKTLMAERDAAKERFKGATMLWNFLRYAASVGLGGFICKLLLATPAT